MVTISDATLRANIYETIYDLISGITYTGLTVTVMSAFPDEKDLTFPLVVVNPANVEYGSFTFNRSISSKEVLVVVDIYTKKNKDVDLISDFIMNTMETQSITGLMLVGVSEDADTTDIEGKKIHNKTIGFTYRRNG